MSTLRRKPVYTTGEVAKICHVAPRTVTKWFDQGALRGYRIPGSRDRRIPLPQLLAFLRAHDIPSDELDGGSCCVLIVDGDTDAELLRAVDEAGRCEIAAAANGFDAGVRAQQFHPHVVILAADDEAAAVSICRHIRSSKAAGEAKVFAAGPQRSNPDIQRLLEAGFDGYLTRPYTVDKIHAAAEQAMNVIS